MATLEEKDRKNREEALGKVIDDARALMKDTDIPPAEITVFEEMLMDFVLLSCLDKRHYELFGLIEGQTLTEEIAIGLCKKLSDEQKNVLKRDFLIRHLTIKNGISKRAALLIELAKHHFPAEIAEIEHIHNEDYQKKWAVIREQMDKLKPENEEMQEVA
jgi:ParB family chromosome partitioning protein